MQGSTTARGAGHWDDEVPHTHRSETSYYTAREAFSPSSERPALSPGGPSLRTMLGKYSSRVAAIHEDGHSTKPPPPQWLSPSLRLGSPDMSQVECSSSFIELLLNSRHIPTYCIMAICSKIHSNLDLEPFKHCPPFRVSVGLECSLPEDTELASACLAAAMCLQNSTA